jgi:hypothetical protein
MEGDMRCLTCRNLEAAFEARRSEYNEAGSLAYYRVSTKLSAYLNVEMERARAELEEHRLECLSAIDESVRQPVIAPLRLAQRQELRSGPVQTAA